VSIEQSCAQLLATLAGVALSSMGSISVSTKAIANTFTGALRFTHLIDIGFSSSKILNATHWGEALL